MNLNTISLPWQARPNKQEVQVREEAMDLNMPQFSKLYHLVLHPLIHYSCSAHVSF
jgi:hypothetical protein